MGRSGPSSARIGELSRKSSSRPGGRAMLSWKIIYEWWGFPHVGLLEFFLKSQVVLDHIQNFKGGKIMKVVILRCHQTWLEHPRTKWRFVAVKTIW